MKDQDKIFNDKLTENFKLRENKNDVTNYLLFKYLMQNKMYNQIYDFKVLPSRVDIEPTTRCFLNCKYCQVPFWNRKEIGDMKFETFTKILDKVPQIFELKLQGQGEPLLNKELLKMVRYATDRGVIVRFNTNGMLLSEDKNKEILNSGLFELRLSLDGATAETNEVMRTGLDFNKVINNIKNLVELRGDSKLPLINVWALMTKQNVGEMKQLITLCHDIGIDGLKIQTKLSTRDFKEIEEKVKEDTIDLKNEVKEDYFTNLREYAKSLDFDLEIQMGKWRTETNHCWWLWNSAYISSEGYVVPCCIISNPDKLNFGNILEKDFSEIWYGEEYRTMRENTLKMKIHKQCKWCYTPM